MTESDYRPVACEAHSLYELAVMHRTHAQVCWQDGDTEKEARLLPLDVETRNREEFLLAETADHKLLRIRLDRILAFTLENRSAGI